MNNVDKKQEAQDLLFIGSCFISETIKKITRIESEALTEIDRETVSYF